jgi:hypothetical protein
MSFLSGFSSIFSTEDERARQDREAKQRQRLALQDAAHFRQQAEQITLPFQAEVFRREADAKIKGLELRLNQDKAKKEGMAFRQFADETVAKKLGGLFGGDSEMRSRRQEAEAARNQSALNLNVTQQGGSGYYQGNERLVRPTVPPDLSDTGLAFGAGQVPGMVQRSGIQTTPEEVARLQRYGPGVAQGLIEQGNIGPAVDIGSQHYGPEGAPPPIIGKIPGFRSLPEMAATLGTAGLGSGGALMKAGMFGGGTGGGYLGREVGGTPGEVIGTLGGALLGGAVAPKIGRALTETIQARPGGFMNEAGGTQLPGAPLKPSTPASTSTLASVLDAPVDEKMQVTVARRFNGEVHQEGDQLRIFRDDSLKLARQNRIPLSHNRTPDAERLFNALETGDTTALVQGEADLVSRLRYALKLEEDAMLAVDPEFSSRLLDDYFPHLFKKTTQTPRNIPSRTGAAPSFIRGRRLEGGIGDILANRADLDLRTWNPVDYVNMRIAEGIKYRAALTLRNRLEAKGFAVAQSAAPEGWIVPQHPIFQGNQFRRITPRNATTAENAAEIVRARSERLGERATRLEQMAPDEMVGGLTVRESMATPPEVAKYLDHVFGASAFGDSLPLHVIRTLSSSAKMVKVFGGLFQHVDYTLRQLGMGIGEAASGRVTMAPRSVGVSLRATLRGFVPGLDNRMLRFDVTDPTRAALTRNGIQLDGGLDIMERSFRDLLAEPGFLTRAGVTDNRATKMAKAAIDYISSGAYLKAHREHVLSAGEMHVKRFMQAGDSLDLAAAKAAKLTNEQFSALPQWQSVFQNPTTRDALRTVFFSPNEAEAWWRNFLKPARGVVRRDIGEVGAGVRFYGGIMGSTVVMANMIHMASTGELLPSDRYNPMDTSRKSPLGIPFTYNTRFLRPTLPFKGPLGQDVYLDLLGQADTPLRWALDPLFGTKSRLSVPASVAVQTAPMLSGQPGRTFSGAPIHTEDVPGYAASIVAPMPAQSFIEERSRIGTGGAGLQAGGLNVSSEPLREMIGRRYEEITGRPFNPEVNYIDARQMPELKPLFDELTRRGIEFESPGAMETAQRQQFLAETEVNAHLPEKARGVVSNRPGAGIAFTDAYKDLQTAAANAVGVDMLGEDLNAPETPEGQALQAYRDLDPSDYFDSTTYETDWGGFFAERDRLKKALPPVTQKALDSRLLSQDTDVQRAEPRYKAAAQLNSAYHDIPKYSGLNPEESDHVDAALRKAEYLRVSSGVDPSRISVRSLLPEITKGLNPNEEEYVILLVTRGERARTALVNPEKDVLALKNPDLFYFGFVSPSSLTLRERAALPDYILQGTQ